MQDSENNVRISTIFTKGATAAIDNTGSVAIASLRNPETRKGLITHAVGMLFNTHNKHFNTVKLDKNATTRHTEAQPDLAEEVTKISVDDDGSFNFDEL